MHSDDPYIKPKDPFEYVLPPCCCKCLVPCTRRFLIRTEGLSAAGTFEVYLCQECSRQMRIRLFLLFLLPMIILTVVAAIRRELIWIIPGTVIMLIGIWVMSKGFLSPAFSDGYSILFKNAEYQKRFKEANSDRP